MKEQENIMDLLYSGNPNSVQLGIVLLDQEQALWARILRNELWALVAFFRRYDLGARLEDAFEGDWDKRVYPLIASDLNFSSDNVFSIPSIVKHLKHLKNVYIYDEKIIDIPQELYDLPNIESLMICACNLQVLDESVLRLSKLKGLSIFDNYVKSLPEEITKLTELEQIGISNNLFNKIPEQLFKLPSLKYVALDENLISKDVRGTSNLIELGIKIVDMCPIFHS